MDSSFSADVPARVGAATDGRPKRWWSRFASATGQRPAGSRARPGAWRSALAFDLRALAALSTGAVLVGACLGAVQGERSQRLHAEARASAVGAEVEALLDRVDASLAAVDAWVRSTAWHTDASGAPCTDTLSRVLTRLSLEAPDTRGVVLQRGEHACGPLGPQAALPGSRLEAAPRGLAVLDAEGPAGTPVRVLRWIDDASVAIAEIDPGALGRAMRLPPARGRESAALLLPGRAGVRAVAPGARGTGEAGRAGAVWWSSSRQLGVRVVPDPRGRTGAIVGPAHAGALCALLVALAAAAWRWQRLLARVRLGERIARGLRKRQFEPHVQPQVDLATGRCVGAEVLVRWRHPVRGLIGAAEFIEEAERSGLIVPMTELIVRRAAQRLAPAARADRSLRFAFNVTPIDLSRPGFVSLLNAEFHAQTVPREQVVLEVTERDALDEVAQQRIVELRAAGWKVSIDDFGTGHSSLALLERLHVDELKIDQAFVRTVDARTVSRPVLDAITALGRDLRVPLIAEGVETAAQAAYLAARGVQHGQGYLFAKPMPIEAFERWLLANAASAGLPLEDDEALVRFEREVVALGETMRGAGGVEVRDRRWRSRVWAQCFVGRDAVDWIVRSRGVSRARAVQLGRALAAFGLLHHVAGEHDFEDARLFYRWERAGEAPRSAAHPAPAGLALALASRHGVSLGDHRRGLAIHRGCTTGRAIVDWIVASRAVPRDRAVQWGEQLMREGRLQHVLDERPFLDDRTLYRPA